MDISKSAPLWVSLLFVALLLGLASCGGGSDSTTPGNPGSINNGGGTPTPTDFTGPIAYNGQQPATPPTIPDTTPPPTPAGWDMGTNIFSVPVDTNGVAKVVTSNFVAGQKAAFVVVNLNPIFLDAHLYGGEFMALPTSSFTIQADLVQKGISSMAPWSQITEATKADLGSLADYKGMPYAGKVQNPLALYEREAQASGKVAFAVEAPAKSASTIQKGDIRTFLNVPPTIPPPPVGPGEENDTDPTTLMWPYEYSNGTDGRLVAIGAHCLVFMSTEINYGHPDTIQFTEDRLTRLAKEFDEKIFPVLTTNLGPVDNYLEGNVLFGLDRSRTLTADDFNQNGELLVPLPGAVDTDLGKEGKILIFIFKGMGGGGFYSWGLSEAARQLLADQGREDDIANLEKVGSTLYIDAANFPANDNGWTSAYSIMAHEFQHKLNKDNGLPSREVDRNAGNYSWFNEGMSQLAIHMCGYTVNSGRIVPWAIDGQLTDFLTHTNTAAVPMDGNRFMDGDPVQSGADQQTQYGNGFLFFLYLYEHYGSGVGKKIYDGAKAGETDYIRLIQKATSGEDFALTYSKFCLANFIDGIYSNEDAPVLVANFATPVDADQFRLYGHLDAGHVGTDLEVYYTDVPLESAADPRWKPLWTAKYMVDGAALATPVKVAQIKLVHRQLVQGYQDSVDAFGLRLGNDGNIIYPTSIAYSHNWDNPENFVDAYVAATPTYTTSHNQSAFDPRFRYNTIDLKGTINLATGTVVLPGVRTQTYPAGGTYPIIDIDRLVYPWCADYLVLTNGDGRDLEVKMTADRNFRLFMLPVEYSEADNAVTITPGVSVD